MALTKLQQSSSFSLDWATVALEEEARDSLQNVMFSLCRFHEVTGHYPAKVTVVGFEFKRERFEGLHRRFLHLSPSQFEYVGLQPPPGEAASKFDVRKAEKGEMENSFVEFSSSPSGCSDERLREKRASRNPFRMGEHPYQGSCPEMQGLLSFCGEGQFDGLLPWE